MVEVTTSTAGGRAVISVANTGPPVPAGDIARLFQPFQRRAPDRTGSDEGLGLGLSIVRAIATAHYAQIETGPGLRGGLTVIIGFPAAAIAPGDEQLGRQEPVGHARRGRAAMRE